MSPYAWLGIALIVAGIFWYVRKSGADSVKSDIGERDAKTAAKVADSVAAAPDSLSAVREHVRNGGKL